MKRLMHISAAGVFGLVAMLAAVQFGGFIRAVPGTAYTCQADGTYASPASGPGAVTSTDLQKVSQANAWLASMMKTTTSVVTTSTITPDTEYASSYQGAVSGTFVLRDRSYTVKNDSSLTITSPDPLTSDYNGVVTGRVLTTPTPWRWIIQVYKRTAGGDVMVSKQALADGTTGEFSIDLSTVPEHIAGDWAFGILDADASYAPYGVKWPSPSYYDGLKVQQLVVTDATYFWNQTNALADGTFSLPNSNTGSKMFRLVDTNTSDVLAEYIKPTGLLRSYQFQQGETGYGTALGERTFTYDQAIALFAAIGTSQDSQAKQLVQGLLRLQTTSGPHAGGFVFSAPQLSPGYTDALYRIGAHAIATDALLAYIQKYPSDTDVASYRSAATQALSFLDQVYVSSGSKSGLYLGGFGQYSGDPQVFDANYVIPWASTEHNIDIWHTFTRAAQVFPADPANYQTKANDLNDAIATKLYSASEQRYYQGINVGGADTADPLDVNSWGSIQMYATGRVTQAAQALSRTDLFRFTRSGIAGYAPFYDSPGYPGAVPTVWLEGSFGVALAQYRQGNYQAYRDLINNLSAAQQNDGSFRYATDADPQYEIGVSKSVAGTAWFVLATAARDAIWNTCTYAPPAQSPSITPTTGADTGHTTSSTSPTPTVARTASMPGNQTNVDTDLVTSVAQLATPVGSSNKSVTAPPKAKAGTSDTGNNAGHKNSNKTTAIAVALGVGALIGVAWLRTVLRRRFRG